MKKFKKILKLTLLFLLVSGVIYFLLNRELCMYGIKMTKGQYTILSEAVPLDDILESDSSPDTLKAKLELIKEIKRFAIDSLGLSETDNYEKLYDQKGKPILWIVTACPPFSLEAYEWEFPLIGSFSYRGFFEKEEAEKLKEEMNDQGLDCSVSEVTAWSTLGWFDDPVLSIMLEKSEGELAELIIHEMTHTTFYVKDSVDFNENLASFVGRIGAKLFLRRKYGEESAAYVAYEKVVRDDKILSEHMLSGALMLEEYYKGVSDVGKSSLYLKNEFIKAIMGSIDTLDLSFQLKYKKENLPNNTYFGYFIRYEGFYNEILEEFRNEAQMDVKSYISYLKNKYVTINN